MSTTTHNIKPKHTLLHSNPVLSRLGKITERSETNAASYAGIAVKTSYFLLVTLVGMIAQLVIKALLANEPVWQTIQVYEKFTLTLSMKETMIIAGVLIAGLVCELVGIFARRTIPVTGTIYSLSQGYVISFLIFKVLKGYEYLGLEALLLTIAVVAAMSWLYSTGKIKDEFFIPVDTVYSLLKFCCGIRINLPCNSHCYDICIIPDIYNHFRFLLKIF